MEKILKYMFTPIQIMGLKAFKDILKIPVNPVIIFLQTKCTFSHLTVK